MALTVETGAGITAADSYASLAEVDAFQAARSNASWAAATVTEREVAIRRATDYLDTYHVSGTPLKAAQGLAWPFEESDETDIITREKAALVKATAMLAPIALTAGDLVARAPDTAQVISSTDKVGDLSESRTYVDRSHSVTMLNGVDVSFLSRVLSGLSSSGGLVIGSRSRG